MAGVLAAGAAPALAADNISSYSGRATGQALTLQVNPGAIANVNLAELNNILSQIDNLSLNGTNLPTNGVNGTLQNTIGSTLANPTAPINISLDTASATGSSIDGQQLASGTADSAPLTVDARSLNTEIDLINLAVHRMPTGTVNALRAALGPIAANNPALADALNKYLPALVDPITGTLGAPSVNALNVGLHADFGQNLNGDITTVEKGGLLTPNDKLSLQPFTARAISTDAFASNAVDNLALVPSGQLGLPTADQVKNALAMIEAALVNAENALVGTTATVGLTPVSNALGQLVPVINGTPLNTITTTGGTVVDLVPINTLANGLAAEISLLGGLDGLRLNDIIGDNGGNAISSLKRDGATVTASGLGTVAHVDVVKINDAALQGILTSISSAAPGGAGVPTVTELASIDGIKGSAHVTLDGVNKADQHATGTLVDIKLLGRSLESYVNGATAATPAGGSVGHVSLDDILPAGSSCTINIPGTSSCHGLPIDIGATKPVQDALNLAHLPSIITVVLTRGIEVVDATANATHGSASITTLQLTASLNCAAIPALTNSLPTLSVPLTLSVCGNGVQGSSTASGATHSSAMHMAGSQGSTDIVPLVNLAMGVASAQLSTSPTLVNTGCTQGCVLPPNTGNDFLLLAALAVAAMAAGIGIQVWKGRAAQV